MNPSDFLDIITRLLSSVRGGSSSRISTLTERNSIRSVVGAWFSQYRLSFLTMAGDEELFLQTDSQMQSLLKLAAEDNARSTVTKTIRAAKDHFADRLLVPLSRAYWSRVPQRTPAGRDQDVVGRLCQLSVDLADSYEQAIVDLEDSNRLSYRGPASELREVLTGVLHILAPDGKVQSTDWYKEARKSGARKEKVPTRAERTKYILRSRGGNSAITEAAESFMGSVEERLADVVVATYKRGSAAAHGPSEHEEVRQLLQYINALLRELLPSKSISSGEQD